MRHHAWHRGLMMLEEEVEKIPAFTNNPLLLQILQPTPTNMQLITMNNLILLYSKLSEFDQYQAVWKRRAYFEETSKAIEYYNEGLDFNVKFGYFRNMIFVRTATFQFMDFENFKNVGNVFLMFAR
ncbi:hypothetical protein WUBG_18773 [Wuchereria bancrofti]|uniref:Uncharacterized protein n=1 Tax=Wuchereria bancrofti TaxID=6293 RepID=J9A8P5_WUCBA|nr:hypothetical protein WUBG_18773 [Wuchereria bancrofti]